jgi:hypothetical protein
MERLEEKGFLKLVEEDDDLSLSVSELLSE